MGNDIQNSDSKLYSRLPTVQPHSHQMKGPTTYSRRTVCEKGGRIVFATT